MVRFIFILLISAQAIGQSIVGQALFTDSQLAELRLRTVPTTGQFISTDFGNNGFFGDWNLMVTGADEFLTQEESGGYVNQWTWMDNSVPIAEATAGNNIYEPRPENSPAGAGTYNVEYIHYAAVVAKIWEGETATITFSGQTKSKNLHSLDLAQAVFNVLIEQANDPKLDFGNTTKYSRTYIGTNNPMFIVMTKMSKYLDSYSMIYNRATGSHATIEGWFADANAFALARMYGLNDEVYGGAMPATYNTASANVLYRQLYNQANSSNYLYYDSAGNNPVYAITRGQGSMVNNRTWDYLSYIGHYGTLFNNAESKTMSFEMFKVSLEMGTFPDGTWMEWFRSYTANPSVGAVYVQLSLYHMTKVAYSHAVAVENGLAGATDRGKYFDFTTSRGTDDYYTIYDGTSTNGGAKGLKLMYENLARYFRTSANGGYIGVRYAQGGQSFNINTRPFTVGAAMANTYYKDAALEDFYMQRTSATYNGARYWVDGGSPAILNVGAWYQHSIGQSWGEAGTHAGYMGVALLEDFVFDSTPPTPPTQTRSSLFGF